MTGYRVIEAPRAKKISKSMLDTFVTGKRAFKRLRLYSMITEQQRNVWLIRQE